MMELKVGDKAPDFEVKNDKGGTVKLSDFRGKEVVLYFYPKDDTSGCTKEACGFRDDFSQFQKKDTVILGVSLDNEESHQKFIQKYNLPFQLLCDTSAEISKKYEVYGKKVLYGKESMGILRTTFIIDKKGNIKQIFEKVDCDNHSRDILKSYGD